MKRGYKIDEARKEKRVERIQGVRVGGGHG